MLSGSCGVEHDRARAAALLRERHGGTDDRVLLVTHGGFGSALVSVLLGLPPCGYMRKRPASTRRWKEALLELQEGPSCY